MRCLRSLWVLLALPALSGRALAAESTLTPLALSTNDLVIICTNGTDFSATVVVFHGDVHVFDPRMYLECELLTALLKTNENARAESAGMTNFSGRVDTIIAETNVLMMGRNLTVIGDRAVYTASNEVVVVTVTLVVIETDKSYSYGTNFVINRLTGEGFAVGPTVVEIKLDLGAGRTNALKPSLGIGAGHRTRAPVPKTKDPAPK